MAAPDLSHSPEDYDSHEAYATAMATLAAHDPDQEYIGGDNGSVETEYAIESDRGECARAHDTELAGLIDELVLYRAGARLIRREVTYGPWRYVTPAEIEAEQ